MKSPLRAFYTFAERRTPAAANARSARCPRQNDSQDGILEVGLRPIFRFRGSHMAARAPEPLYRLIEPAVTALGYELVGIEYAGSGGRRGLLRIYIDTPDGITVEDCGRVSHQVSGVLDVEDVIQGQYTLEVSSPGLDRPLFLPAHYQRFAGQLVKLRLAVPQDGRRNLVGVLRGTDGDNILIMEEGNRVSVPLQNIHSARLVPEI